MPDLPAKHVEVVLCGNRERENALTDTIDVDLDDDGFVFLVFVFVFVADRFVSALLLSFDFSLA